MRKIVILFLCFVNALLAQKGEYNLYTIKEGLSQQQVTCIFKDSRGLIWIGTKSGLNRFNGDQIESINLPKYAGDYIVQIDENINGNILITSGFYLCEYNGNKFINSYPLPDKGLSSLSINKEGKLLLCMADKLYELKENKFVEFQLPGLEGKLISGISLFQDTFYVKIEKSIYKFKDQKKITLSYQSNTTVSPPYVNNDLFTIHEDFPNGKVYYEYQGGEWKKQLEYIDYKSKTFNTLNRYYNFNNTIVKIKNGNIDTLLQQKKLVLCTQIIKKDNRLFVGTETGFLILFDNSFEHLNENYVSATWGILEDFENNMIFANNLGAFTIFKRDSKKYIDLKNQFKSHPFYFHPTKDNKGNLYFNVCGVGILKIDKNKNKTYLEKKQCFLYLDYDEQKDMIFGGCWGGVKFIGKDTTFFLDETKGLKNFGYGLCIVKDKDKNYWASSSRGVCKIDNNLKVIRNYSFSDSSLPFLGALTMEVDYRNNIWFGPAFESGLWVYISKENKFIEVLPEIIKRSVCCIKCINNKLLIGANDGLYLLDLNEYYKGKTKIRLFNYYNGYFGIEPNQNSIYLDSKGKIWISSSTFTVTTDTANLNFNNLTTIPNIRRLNGEKIAFNEQFIKLLKGINTINFDVEAIGFERTLKQEFSYRVKGFSDYWTTWSSVTNYTLSNLSSGIYTIEVRTKSIVPESVSLPITELKVEIDLPFWKEPYFYKFAFFLLVGLSSIALFFYLKEKRLERINKNRESELKLLRVQTLQSQINPHFIFNTLGTLQGLILKSDTQNAINHLGKLSMMIRRFLDISVNSNNISSERTLIENEISLEIEIELIKMYIDFERLQYKESFDYEINIDNNLQTSSYTIPPLIIQPYVENAIKHGLFYKKEKGVLTIDFILNNDDLKVKIKDNGIGREKSTEIQAASKKIFKSHGTTLVQDRIKLLNDLGYNINIIIKDNLPEGTIVEILFKQN